MEFKSFGPIKIVRVDCPADAEVEGFTDVPLTASLTAQMSPENAQAIEDLLSDGTDWPNIVE